MATQRRIVSTHDLRDGDVVLYYGMRVVLSGEGVVTGHPINEHSPCLAWDATIENMEDVRAEGVVPLGFIRDGKWTVQGNGLARWEIEREQ